MSQLQRWDQRVREGRTVAAGAGIVQRNLGEEAGAQRHQFQRWYQRVREGRAVAASSCAAQRDVGGEVGARLSANTGISACGKGEQWQRALALLSEMREAKLELNVFSYSGGISACGKGKQWQRALALLSEMREAKLDPDSAITLGSARARRASSGSEPWRCSARCGRRSWSQTQLQRWDQRVREGRAVAAGSGAAQRDTGGEAGAQRHLSTTALGSARATRACSGSGPWRCSARCGRRSWSPTSSATTLGSAFARRAISGSGLWRCSAKCGRRSWSPTQLQRWDQRVREWRSVAAGSGATQRDAGRETGARPLVSYNAGISACEKGKQWQRALALLSEMWEAKLEPDVFSFGSGISACCKDEQWQRALALLGEMRVAKLEPDVFYITMPVAARAR
ncbi:unnamed protein product [Prorocentrum cordatum]|uniref:Uncharacterized protein n=1 Tax=Prorocentrum cordatum TaxID=2364126 RepID=A0ABN9UGT0_9DINO|nr:unnamed protein product [Polarella glacialis]